MKRRAHAGVALVAALLVAGTASAQTVERVGSSDVALDRRLGRLLAGNPVLVTSDRRVEAGDTLRRSVLVLDATLILEGTVLGDLVVVDGGVFVRDPARVTGDVVNIAGGLYRSELAGIGGTIIDLPDASYRVLRESDRIMIEAYSIPDPLTLDGFAGFTAPTYDRANGVSIRWGAGYRLPRVAGATPVLKAYGGWRTEPGEPLYGGSLQVRGGAVTVATGYDRGSATREGWAIDDLRNSLNYLWDGDDQRNYFAAEQVWAGIEREFGDVAKSFHAVLRATVQVEDAASLEGGNPWHILGDSARPNPAISDGRISSLVGGLELAWHGLETDLTVSAEYEAAGGWQDGEHVFDRATVLVGFATHTVLDHTLQIRAFGQTPVGRDTLPEQRWSVVGGAATLYTVPVGGRRGDHVAFIESRYRVPTGLPIPLLGPPELQLVHAAGTAWVGDRDPRFVQEVGGRIQFFSPYVQYMVRPGSPSVDRVVIGFVWPLRDRFPWEL